MSRKMKLIQGEVIIRIDVSSFVDEDMDSVEEEEHLKELAINNIESGEIEYEFLTDVYLKVDDKVCEKYEGKTISNSEWKEIVRIGTYY